MALIAFESLDKRISESQGTVIALQGVHYVCKTRKLNEVKKTLPDNDFIHWVSNGDWSMHELLLLCLSITGPANVYISSYAFSEKPARIIADLKNKGHIQELHCLIDSRIDVRSAGAFQLVQGCATTCKLVNTHAKVTVIENETHQIAIVCSANYTTNERYEAGYISKLPELAAFNKEWITDEIAKE